MGTHSIGVVGSTTSTEIAAYPMNGVDKAIPTRVAKLSQRPHRDHPCGVFPESDWIGKGSQDAVMGRRNRKDNQRQRVTRSTHGENQWRAGLWLEHRLL